MSLTIKSRLSKIKIALERNIITPLEASKMLHALEFSSVKNDILKWGKYMFPDKFSQPFCEELHRYFIEIAKEPFTATLAPRGHAKTTIKCFLIPIYFALENPTLYRHYLNIQATASKAIAGNISIKNEFETNPRLLLHYGNQMGEKWTEKQFVLKNGVVFTALGAGESVRGINYRNMRPDYVVGDDLYDENCLENPSAVEKINRWFMGAIYKAVSIDRKVSMHIQGTAISQKDLMHILSSNSEWKFKKFQSVDWDSKKILWHENSRITINQLENDKKTMGSIIFEREMQNNCRDDSTSIIKQAWIQFYDFIPEHEEIVAKIMYVDPAISTKEYNDFTGKAIVYKTSLGNHYIEQAFNDKMTFNENMIHIKQLHNLYSFNEVRIEAIAAFQALSQELMRTTSIPIKELKSVKDKISRLVGIQNKFENRKVFIKNAIDTNVKNEMVNQLINNHPDHDDLRDAVVGALEDSTREFHMFVL